MLIGAVVCLGTVGYVVIEGWSVSRSLFFTLITMTTVGYSDYGLSPAGERFTSLVLVLGVGVFTYGAGQLLGNIIELQNDWERRMERAIAKLSGHHIVCGLGRLGRGLCDELERAGVAFVCIDTDRALVEEAVRRGWIAIIGDATEDDTLRRANIDNAAGLACVTNSDAENIVITLAGRERCEDLPIVSRAEHDESIRRLRRAGATRIISPIRSGGRTLARTIAQPHLASLLDADAEQDRGVRLAEVAVCECSPLVGRTLRECGADHSDVVFVCMRREGDDHPRRPSVDDRLRAGDVLIAAASVESLGRFTMDALPGARAAA
ncbi:MAG: potassium channel family protein [Phycisphaerales bacterium]